MSKFTICIVAAIIVVFGVFCYGVINMEPGEGVSPQNVQRTSTGPDVIWLPTYNGSAMRPVFVP